MTVFGLGGLLVWSWSASCAVGWCTTFGAAHHRIIDGVSTLKQGVLVEGTANQDAPTLVVRDHVDYGGFGLGNTVRFQVGDPSADAHVVLNSPGTGVDAIDIDSAGGVAVDAGSQFTVTTGSLVRLSSGDEVRAIAAQTAVLQSEAGAVYVVASSTTPARRRRRRLGTVGAVSSAVDDGSVVVDAAQDVVLNAAQTVALQSDTIVLDSTNVVRVVSGAEIGLEATETVALHANDTATIQADSFVGLASAAIGLYAWRWVS